MRNFFTDFLISIFDFFTLNLNCEHIEKYILVLFKLDFGLSYDMNIRFINQQSVEISNSKNGRMVVNLPTYIFMLSLQTIFCPIVVVLDK